MPLVAAIREWECDAPTARTGISVMAAAATASTMSDSEVGATIATGESVWRPDQLDHSAMVTPAVPDAKLHLSHRIRPS